MTIVRLVPHFSDPDEAVRKFCAKSLRVPYSLELVYLPFVLFRYNVEMTPFWGGKRTAEGLFLADMIQGVPMNIKKGTALEAAPSLGAEFSSLIPSASADGNQKESIFLLEPFAAPAAQVLPAVLSQGEAVIRGKKMLRYDLMRLAGGLRYRKTEITISAEAKIIYYPFWLIYFRNRRRDMTCGVLDGLTGRRESGEIVTSLKLGLLREERISSKVELSKGAHPI